MTAPIGGGSPHGAVLQAGGTGADYQTPQFRGGEDSWVILAILGIFKNKWGPEAQGWC